MARSFLPSHPLPKCGSFSPDATSLSVSNFLLLVSPPGPSLTWLRRPCTPTLLLNTVPSFSVPPPPPWGLCDSHFLLISLKAAHHLPFSWNKGHLEHLGTWALTLSGLVSGACPSSLTKPFCTHYPHSFEEPCG